MGQGIVVSGPSIIDDNPMIMLVLAIITKDFFKQFLIAGRLQRFIEAMFSNEICSE